MPAGSELIWSRKKQWWLWPVAALFRCIVSIRRTLYTNGWLKRRSLPVPVIIVGNLPVGGVGKTPITIALAQWLIKVGLHPGVISRGYGRQGNGVLEVMAEDTPTRCGDEPLLIKRRVGCPVVVGSDRVAAAQTLLARYPDCQVILADDGLQHYRLNRDLELAVFDRRGVGNGQLLPMGPLREPWERLKTVSAVIINHTDTIKTDDWGLSKKRTPERSSPQSYRQTDDNTPSDRQVDRDMPSYPQILPSSLPNLQHTDWVSQFNRLCANEQTIVKHDDAQISARQDDTGSCNTDMPPVFHLYTQPHCFVNVLNPDKTAKLHQFQQQSVIAVTGIGNPGRFFDTLTHLGVRYRPCVFPDHHAFSASDFFGVAETDIVIMTEKDAVKSRPFSTDNWWFLKIETHLPDNFIEWLYMELTRLHCLVCPICKGKLEFDREAQELICHADRLAYPIKDAIPVMMENQARKMEASDSGH